MLATHLLSKNIKTQITLSFQRLNVTFDIIRCNSSSSDSSSDSDSDSDTPFSKRISNESSKSFKSTNYLQNANRNKERRKMDQILSTTAKMLTMTPSEVDRQKVMSNLLNNISNIQNSNNNIPKRQNEFTKTTVENIKSYQSKKQHIENNFKKEPSIIGMLKNEYNQKLKRKSFETQNIRNTEKQWKYFDLKKPSVLQTLIDNQKIQAKLIQKQYETNNNLKRDKSNYKFNRANSVINKTLEQKTDNDRYGNPYMDLKVNLFHKHGEVKDGVKLKIWDEMEKSRLYFIKNSFITNAFEEMIQWTEEGKLWKFPIDNEQGMEKEQNVHFSKHVFLEHYLTPWCPNKGPIRHFMELVCIGLSKNPYMTFQEKYDHITWYKNYFQDKQDLLQNLGAIV
ncbi:PREDICTED: 28S ribosomal protein S31, mitochondrial [Eufriesea mexicana]|uniref:28S ribosomal protein S31, mitochondrial n=1 Tax=Eufriesea mexicana TaxID=516756 RepID=UPI00083C3770|nr:PREDICTED: 28S ribosomal protein S31, mitochondrial [Eufriesea mexicana]